MTESDRPLPPLDSLLEQRAWVRSVARRLMRDEQAADDLAQEAWVRAMRSPPDPARDPRPWFRRVLKNLASNARRGAGRRSHHESAGAEHAARQARAVRSPAALVAEAEQHRRLVGHVLDLDEPFKTVLVLRFYEGLAPAEIAQRMETAIGTVHSRLFRAVERLKARLDAEEGGDRRAWLAGLFPLVDGSELAPVAAGAGTAAATAGVLMALNKSTFAWLTVLVLGCLIGGGVYLASLTSGDPEDASLAELHGVDTPAEGPALETRGPLSEVEAPEARAAEAPPPVDATPRTTWRGRVLDPDDRPINRAMVFVLPKTVEGIQDDAIRAERFARTFTDEQGRFEIAPGEMEDPRVVAWTDDMLPASVRLSTVDPAEPITLRLGAARIVTLGIRMTGVEGLLDLSLRVQATEPGYDFSDDPSKQALLQIWDEPEVAPTEEIVAVLNTTRPVRITARPPPGMAVVPPYVVVEKGAPRADFHIMPSARVAYRLVDDATGKELGPDIRTTLYVWADSDKRIAVSMSTGQPRFEARTGLAPGGYHYEFAAQGYELVRGTLRIARAGQSIGGELRLKRQLTPPGGKIHLRVRDRAEVSAAVRAIAAVGSTRVEPQTYVVMVRPQGGAWLDTLATLQSDGRLLVQRFELQGRRLQFKEGVYDIYVARRSQGTAGLLRSVRLFEDQDSSFDIDLEPGTFLRLRDVVDADSRLEAFAVHMDEVGTLPLVEFKSWGWRTFATEKELRSLLIPPRQQHVLGPFPAGMVHVRVVPAGKPGKSLEVRGASVVAR